MVLKNLFTGQQWRNRHKEKTYGHGVRGGEGEMYGKSNVETTQLIISTSRHKLLFKKDIIEVDKPRTYYSEVSHKEKDKYRILTHIYRI